MTFFRLSARSAARGASRVVNLQNGRSGGGEADLPEHDTRPRAGRRGETLSGKALNLHKVFLDSELREIDYGFRPELLHNVVFM